MPIDPMIARGIPQPNPANALAQVGVMQQRDRALAQDAEQNTLMQQRFDRSATLQDNALAAEKKRAMREQAGPILYQAAKAGDPRALEIARAMAIEDFPQLAKMPPEVANQAIMQGLEKTYGEKLQPNPVRTRVSGGSEVQEEFDPKSGKWTEIGRGARWAPQQAPQPSADERERAWYMNATEEQRALYDRMRGTKGGGATLSPADSSKARAKLTQIKIARNQLENAKTRYAALKNTVSAGPGGGLLPTPEGQAFDKAIDSMRGSITALTRVPGVGAMSDFETRLDQAKFPTRNLYEQVGSQQLQALDDLIGALEQGYSEMLGNAPATPTNPAPSPESDPLSAHEGKVITQNGKRYQVMRGSNGKFFAQELK
jgi:hypothetical protein